MKHFIRLAALAALTLLAAAAGAQERGTTPLTAKEIADGWILLFDGETPFGWEQRGDATWRVENGTLAAVPGSGKGVLSTTTVFPSYRLKAEFWVDEAANSGVFLRCPTSGEITQQNAYEVNIYDKHPMWPTGSINDVARASGRAPRTTGRWNSYEITADGDRLVVLLNGRKTVDTRDSKYRRGTIGLQYNGEGTVRFRNVKLQPLGLKSLFNGKDLTGWKEIPGRKSVYSVTPEGWLNVKDGNGDLQSEAQFGDFVFQLDIISNGTHLNSGVFFRGTPGEFWSGYESQIRNQWEGDDRTKPVDYGTGGVYNRQPARRVIPSDREWFTKTIVAHGPHIAVWVNGIQVSDFTDMRPPNNNARQGYRAAPGVVSLQGHDPTTDLSFRNLKIAEMPAGR
ncbi:MAG: DUF1080 domain-containing protein [Armatimonadota bacterium]